MGATRKRLDAAHQLVVPSHRPYGIFDRAALPYRSLRVALALARELPEAARWNLLFDSLNGLGSGLFTALVINLVPVIARRLGAETLLLAAISATPFAANVVGLLSVIWLLRGRRAQYIAAVQTLGRGAFVLAVLGDWPVRLLLMFFAYYLSYALSVPVLYDALREMYRDR